MRSNCCGAWQVPGKDVVPMTMAECQAMCDNNENCGAFDVDYHALDGTSKSECCLFLNGHTGNGMPDRNCMLKLPSGMSTPGAADDTAQAPYKGPPASPVPIAIGIGAVILLGME